MNAASMGRPLRRAATSPAGPVGASPVRPPHVSATTASVQRRISGCAMLLSSTRKHSSASGVPLLTSRGTPSRNYPRAIVVVSALLRDFSPRTGRALAVGLVTVGTIAANWFSTFLAGHVLNSVGTWQHMFLIYGAVAVGIWLLLWLFGREPSFGYRAQVIYSLRI